MGLPIFPRPIKPTGVFEAMDLVDPSKKEKWTMKLSVMMTNVGLQCPEGFLWLANNYRINTTQKLRVSPPSYIFNKKFVNFAASLCPFIFIRPLVVLPRLAHNIQQWDKIQQTSLETGGESARQQKGLDLDKDTQIMSLK